MKPQTAALVALAIGGLTVAPAAASLNMNEGLWETTLTADGRVRSSIAKCYTREDIIEMERLLQGKSSRVAGVCRYADFSRSGDSVRYTMTCHIGDDELKSAVFATYRGDSAKGTLRSASGTVTASSRRIGSCTQSSFAR